MKQCVIICSAILFYFLCSSLINTKQNAPSEFDLNNPVVYPLPDDLDEISGIVYHSQSKTVFAVDDEKGNLFQFSLAKKITLKKWHVGKARDYEGIALTNNRFYLLASNGSITSFPFSFPVTDVVEFDSPVKKKNEFESLYFAGDRNQLMMICKDCRDDKKGETTVFAFDLQKRAFDENAGTKIKLDEIEKKAGMKIGSFRPSAATKHPSNGNVYILSSINHVLVVMDAELKRVLQVYPLDKKIFGQPEGIAFTPEGDLLISNEAVGKSPSNVLFFQRKK
ncbi:MAG: hypothetical protein EON98_03940 [Chitinophagaceae bacterium]|nr:MAG: hypothetical protein EON98_03940 [Chitinophagaceae bacterium]